MRAAATLVWLSLLLAACGGRAPALPAAQAAAPAPGPATTRAETIDAPREQSFDGVLEAVNQSTVSAQTSGRIVELPVDVNDAVRKGDVLAAVRDAEPRAQLQAAQAALRQAQADYLRVKQVFDRKLIAQAQMDRATAARDTAQAAVDAAAEQQEHALIRAPFAGIVTARPVELGELATPGRPIVTLLSLDRLRAVVDVPQQFVGAVRAGGSAQVVLPDGAALDAAALHIFPYADEHAHTFRVRAELPAAGVHDVYPGELVKVVFRLGARRALAVPQAALAYRGEVTGLYVAGAAARLEFRAVRAGAALPGGRVEIVAGLDPGEAVADDPVAAAALVRRQNGDTP
ncbi:MAG: efflux RND transporter periplasmic adaptor subunit [Nevskia sp.]|nr:efflux RND transporter periplasmic adaptor subunit [Nevskia sp.]